VTTWLRGGATSCNQSSQTGAQQMHKDRTSGRALLYILERLCMFPRRRDRKEERGKRKNKEE